MELALPHRLSFVPAKYCDICHQNQDATRSVALSGSNSMFGWDVCTAEKCQEEARQRALTSTIPEDALVAVFGNNISVMRSNGILQSGWQISTNGFIGVDMSPEWFINVRLPDQHKSKLVTLEELELWNQVEFPLESRFATK